MNWDAINAVSQFVSSDDELCAAGGNSSAITSARPGSRAPEKSGVSSSPRTFAISWAAEPARDRRTVGTLLGEEKLGVDSEVSGPPASTPGATALGGSPLPPVWLIELISELARNENTPTKLPSLG